MILPEENSIKFYFIYSANRYVPLNVTFFYFVSLTKYFNDNKSMNIKTYGANYLCRMNRNRYKFLIKGPVQK
jgi:hypothetical protein